MKSQRYLVLALIPLSVSCAADTGPLLGIDIGPSVNQDAGHSQDAGHVSPDAVPLLQIDTGPAVRADASIPGAMAAPTRPPLSNADCQEISDYLELDQQIADNPVNGRLQYPIILQHGMMGFRNIGPILEYYNRIPGHLRSLAYEVFLTQTEPSDASSVRSQTLARQIRCILRITGHDKVHLVGHSQGGIDARRIASDPRYGSSLIKSVTTIATPHRGTVVADAYLELAPHGADPIVDAVLNVYRRLVDGPESPSDFRQQLEEMSTAYMEQFNRDHPDHPDIAYRSWAGRSVPNLLYRDFAQQECSSGIFENPHRLDLLDPMFRVTWQIVRDRDGINDGLVSIRSAKWGEFQGCVPADHIDEVGLLWDPPRDLISGFEYLVLFERIAEAM